MKLARGYLPSAMLFFSFGFLYYIITPVLAFFALKDSRYVEIAKGSFGNLENVYGLEYFATATIGYVLFFAFYKFGNKVHLGNVKFAESISYYKVTPSIIAITLLLMVALATVKGILNGVVLFSGYSEYNIAILGPYATTIFCSVIFMNYFEKKYIKMCFLIIFICTSSLLMGLGSRMFFLLGVISIILNMICVNPNIVKKPLFLSFLVSLFILILGVGIWRSSGVMNLTEILGVFIAEPLFTSISSVNYFRELDDYFIINMPKDIFAALINFVPSFIFPKKLEFMDMVGYDIKQFSPFGASSLLVNVHLNFGIFFFVYFSMIGFLFGILRKAAFYNRFFYAVYLSSLPLLMFHFYREGFVTYIKVQFFNGIIFPAVIIIILGTLLRKRA